jgi:hypothetical protein
MLAFNEVARKHPGRLIDQIEWRQNEKNGTGCFWLRLKD